MTELLVEIDANPIPEGARADYVAMPDGTRLRYAVFPATGRPHKGTVIILQGRNEFIEKYFETVRDLSARGFMVATFDLRGQGRSDRMLRNRLRGYVESFDDYVSDLDFFFENVALPDCRAPFFILGHSTGSLIAILAAPRMENRVRRMVLSAPLIRFGGRHSERVIRLASGFLNAFGLGTVYMSGGASLARPKPFEGNALTSDRRRYERNQAIIERAPDLALGGPTVAWIAAALRAMDQIEAPEFLDAVRVPILLVPAALDTVVSTPATERIARRMHGAGLVTIDGAKHELLQEADFLREQFLASFDAFVPGSGDPMR